MTFAEQMKIFANDVTATRDDRSAAVTRFKKETEHLLNGARARIKQTGSPVFRCKEAAISTFSQAQVVGFRAFCT